MLYFQAYLVFHVAVGLLACVPTYRRWRKTPAVYTRTYLGYRYEVKRDTLAPDLFAAFGGSWIFLLGVAWIFAETAPTTTEP